MPKLDVRDLEPSERHPRIESVFEGMDSGEVLELVNDHDPKPLFYEMRAEQPDFDAENYEVEERGPDEFVARFPKQ
jgi:uncharacterized protein (DUF2249 family)